MMFKTQQFSTFSYKQFNISEFRFQHKDLLFKKKEELKRELSLIQQEFEKEREMVIHVYCTYTGTFPDVKS